jgi:sigma-E factor negative regulatory protein RseB
MTGLRRWAGLAAALALGGLWAMEAASVAGDESPEARRHIERMVEAADALSFHGLLIHAQGDHIESLELVRWIDGGVRERVHTLRGPQRELLRHEQGMRWAMPDRGVVVHEQRPRPQGRFSAISREQLAVLSNYYSLDHGGTDRIAGREAQVVTLHPRDEYRYSYRLWVDDETGLLLASQCLSEHGSVIEQFMFVQLEFDPDVRLREPVVPLDGLAVVSGPDSDAISGSGDPAWRATDLPPGFALLRHGRRLAPGGAFEVEHLLYGDGFAAVSVYVAPSENLDFTGHSRHGATRIAATTIDGHHVTLVGEVPTKTLERVLLGIERRVD